MFAKLFSDNQLEEVKADAICLFRKWGSAMLKMHLRRWKIWKATELGDIVGDNIDLASLTKIFKKATNNRKCLTNICYEL